MLTCCKDLKLEMNKSEIGILCFNKSLLHNHFISEKVETISEGIWKGGGVGVGTNKLIFSVVKETCQKSASKYTVVSLKQ